MRTGFFRLCCLLASVLLRLLANVELPDVDVRNRRGRGVLIVANHRSVVDILVGLTLFGRWRVTPRMLVKAGYFAVPGVGLLLKSMGAIPASRDTAREAMRAASRTLAEGGSVALAPEGRIPSATDRTEGVGELRTGVGRLASEFGTPIVAIGIANTDEVWPLGVRRPRVRVRRASRPTVRVAAARFDVDAGADLALVMTRLRAVLSQVVHRAETPPAAADRQPAGQRADGSRHG
ncbi:1-acyl-sn-glycerol-3-phosphate acyltransferase [Micromonospora sp. KC723]|uniref:lysophospholipid acyltransferase family protein n=1 Tax=Micromonospora sp. KC723 TaxID=2530381 RepID=UPI001404E20D|nr:lysophospholipid acyltransferase family protein [Micromonospora sp. KC723]